jgi:hypothetical protein
MRNLCDDETGELGTEYIIFRLCFNIDGGV